MKFFVDGCDLDEIQELCAIGVVDGVTTNPSIIARSGRNFKDVILDICKIVSGPVSAEVIATDAAGMIKEGVTLASIAKNVCVKLPLTQEGLKACHILAQKGIQTNVTLCFSAGQALMAAKAGATFVSPFIGRLDDIGHDGLGLIDEICHIYAQYPSITTEVLVASVRHPRHILEAARMGAHVMTAPAKIIKQLLSHPLTSQGLDAFLKEWNTSGQKL